MRNSIEYFIVTLESPGGGSSQVFSSIEDARVCASLYLIHPEVEYRVAIHSNTESPMEGDLCTVVHYLSLESLRDMFPNHDLPNLGDIQYLMESWEDHNEGLTYLSFSKVEDAFEYGYHIAIEYGKILPMFTNDRKYLNEESYKTTQEIETMARELIF